MIQPNLDIKHYEIISKRDIVSLLIGLSIALINFGLKHFLQYISKFEKMLSKTEY